MHGRRWLEELRAESLRRGLPAGYVDRLAAELADHLVDLKEETMHREMVCDDVSIESRLGKPWRVAGAAVEARGGILRRSRLAAFAVFAVLPVPALFVLWVAAGALWYAAGELFVFVAESSGRAAALATWAGEHEAAGVVLLRLIIVSAVMVPAGGLAAAYCRLSKRTSRGVAWATVGCIAIAAASVAVRHQVTPADESGHGNVQVGVGTGAVSGWQIAQAAVPTAVGVGFVWRTGRSREPVSA